MSVHKLGRIDTYERAFPISPAYHPPPTRLISFHLCSLRPSPPRLSLCIPRLSSKKRLNWLPETPPSQTPLAHPQAGSAPKTPTIGTSNHHGAPSNDLSLAIRKRVPGFSMGFPVGEDKRTRDRSRPAGNLRCRGAGSARRVGGRSRELRGGGVGDRLGSRGEGDGLRPADTTTMSQETCRGCLEDVSHIFTSVTDDAVITLNW